MKILSKKQFFIFINFLLLIAVWFTSTASAQVPVKPPDTFTTYTTRQRAPIPTSGIETINNCYQYILSGLPDFGDVEGLEAKIPRGVKLWFEWGPRNSTYNNVTEKKTWSASEVITKTRKEWHIDIAPDTVYSWVLAIDIPAGENKDRILTKFTYPTFFKTNKDFLCLAEAEGLFFQELDSLSTSAMFSPSKKSISAFSFRNDPDAIPLAMVPAGTILPGTFGNCTAGAKMSKSGAFICNTSVVERFNAMVEAAAADGIILKSGSYSGLRNVDMQKDMRINRRCRGDAETGCPGGRIAGLGQSNHGNGEAADFQCISEPGVQFGLTSCYRWLRANAKQRFGFDNKLADDLVHWSPTGR